MLRITNFENEAGLGLKVEGKLAEPCVSELESTWNRARGQAHNGQIVVDLSEMTYLDSRGEEALITMVAEGARLVAKGIYCEYVVEQIMKKAHKAGTRRHARNGSGSNHYGQELQHSLTKETH